MEVVFNDPPLVLSGQMPSQSVACPTGKVALGGGAWIDFATAGTLVLRTSAPVLAGTHAVGWTATVTTASGGSISATWNARLTVYAICASVQ